MPDAPTDTDADTETPDTETPDTDTPDTDTEETPAPAPDPIREALFDTIDRTLGDAVVAHEIAGSDIWLRIDRGGWTGAHRFLKEQLHFDYFCFLSGLDWMRSDELATRYEKVWPEPSEDREPSPLPENGDRNRSSGTWVTGITGGDTRFQVFTRLYSPSRKLGITLKADLDDEKPEIDTLVNVFRGAEWHERETWEMFGFNFRGHPGLRHLYLPGEFEGHPLRKDFPLLARVVKPWPGLVDKEPIPGEGDAEDGDGDSNEGGAEA